MALKNTQYDTIMREYYRKQAENKRRQDACIQDACAAIPELSRIDGLIASLSVEQARKLLDGDASALADLKEQIAILGDQRRTLLRSHGYPEDYLEMHYTCPDCRDTGFQGSRKCHCFKQAVIDLLYTQSNIRDILAEENFDTFSFDYYSDQIVNPATGLSALATMQKLVTECKEFIRFFDRVPDNFFFYGETGVGKTFLSPTAFPGNCSRALILSFIFQLSSYLTCFQRRPSEGAMTFPSCNRCTPISLTATC